VISHVRVAVRRANARALTITYTVTGKIDAIRWPTKVAPARTDGLWNTTCFEAFIRPAPAAAYLELNFSPSTAWAAYTFTNTREGMANAEIAPPTIETHTAHDTCALTAKFEPNLPAGFWHIALTAVIEETNGRKSYWALTHPAPKPDFHHPDGFTLELA
jgi:hypothetical protein